MPIHTLVSTLCMYRLCKRRRNRSCRVFIICMGSAGHSLNTDHSEKKLTSQQIETPVRNVLKPLSYRWNEMAPSGSEVDVQRSDSLADADLSRLSFDWIEPVLCQNRDGSSSASATFLSDNGLYRPFFPTTAYIDLFSHNGLNSWSHI